MTSLLLPHLQLKTTFPVFRVRPVAMLAAALGLCLPLWADVGGIGPRPLVDVSAPESTSKFAIDSRSTGQVTLSHSDNPTGVVVTCAPGDADYPGVSVTPEGAPSWDFSPYGDVQVQLTNLGTQPITFGLRVDDTSGVQNASQLYLQPGQSGTCKVIFGISFDHATTPINSKAVPEVLMFVGKATTVPEIFRIESVIAGGVAGEKPPINPADVRVKPPGGKILGPGATALDQEKNLDNRNGAQGTFGDSSGTQVLRIDFPANNADAGVGIKPEMGLFLLTEGTEVRAKVRNDGASPVTPKLSVLSNGGKVESPAAAPLAPGAETELVASYISPNIWKNTPPAITNDPGTGNTLASNQVTSVLISAATDSTIRTLTVESVVVDSPPYSAPDWLGKRPPVAGDWTQTFDEEFNGKSIDTTKWNVSKAPNYWDQQTHFTKDDIIVDGGTMKLRYEKKTGFQSDDPTKKKTDYAAGYLDTYGRWVQRYGYWEARMKVNRAPGLWSAFWLMPDRGAAAGPQWVRSDTAHGGMEFDIMEFLSGQGPYRYNIAMHWDGYGADHKSTGSDKNYVQVDQDGYITSGLLWTPGSAIYYCNGKEIMHYENERVSNVPSFIIFDTVSGGWDNLPLEDAKLPSDFAVDYVRVWQRKDLASAVDGMVKNPGDPYAPAPAPAPSPTK